ncbi:MAG: NUDIX domain-containing protein, partial [Candidatus Moranbacteria bacterium]|nr:NUDIX domain-containing protein [Candidatus Moranbacteria bacterium]
GTIEEGETYDSNIYKEAEEEIGLKNQVFTKDRKVKREGEHNFFCQWYYLMINKELGYFKIQEEEVEQIKWFDEEDLREEIKSNPKKFTPSMKKTFKVFNNKN